MKKYLLFFIGISMFIFCDGEEFSNPKPQSDSINKILPLGASRVEGDSPEFESYRYELWKELMDNGWIFDFIGTQSDEAFYPPYKGQNFDFDHEGRSGWTSEQILNQIEDWLNETGVPDIVLFSSPGGNDALENRPFDQVITNIIGIIEILQKANPSITILIEQMAPAHSESMTPDLIVYHERLLEEVLTIAAYQSTASSQVIAVDMFSEFEDRFLADAEHYNQLGAKFIASRYYDVLKNVLKQ
jgi:lysophospholipase L1-like esterase